MPQQFPWRNKVSNPAQVGGIETSVLDNGPGRGSRIAWFDTGSGLQFKVLIERAADICEAFYNRYSLAWLSHGGTTAPRPDANRGMTFLETFPGGLVSTCGLDHTGGPELDEFGERGLHGQINNCPAMVESIVQPNLRSGNLEMSLTATVRQTRVFGPSYEMRRTISATIGQPKIRLHDAILNCGNTPAPLMVLYHCNFGWPLIDEGARLLWRGETCPFGSDLAKETFKQGNDYKRCPGPLQEHRSTGEACAAIDVEANEQGLCTVGIHNRELGLALKMEFRKQQLPWVTNWQHFGPDEYVTALEPGTHPPFGQKKVREDGTLVFLEPGESRTFELLFRVLSTGEEIGELINTIED